MTAAEFAIIKLRSVALIRWFIIAIMKVSNILTALILLNSICLCHSWNPIQYLADQLLGLFFYLFAVLTGTETNFDELLLQCQDIFSDLSSDLGWTLDVPVSS